jgi:aldehyde:ferredoxin oxidoreductase
MRWAGYDHLVITGRSERPVYIWVNDDDVEIRDADNMWGMTTGEADTAIKRDLGDGGVETACIGPAGENMVTFSSLTVSRHRSAGRTGGGCVFGSKNLKAIAARGTKGVSVYNWKSFLKATDDLLTAINVKPEYRENLKKYGTLRLVAPFNHFGWNAFRNGQGSQSPEIDKLNGDWYLNTMRQRHVSCSPGCAAVCQHWHHMTGDESPLAAKLAGEYGQRPEYGIVGAFGISCDVRDLPMVAHLGELCNTYSLDSLEAGMTISFVMELWQRGIITEQDMLEWTGESLSLDWGNYEAVAKLLEIIALQKNRLGEILKGGVYRAAKVIEEIKGMEVLPFANYGKGGSTHVETMRPRPGFLLAGAVAAVGCNHLKGLGVDEKTSRLYFGKPDAGDPFSPVLKGSGHALSEVFSCITNSLGLCRWAGAPHMNIADFPLELYTSALLALTGMEITPEEIYTAGERILNIEKAFNSRLGLRREDDVVCHRWMNEPVTAGLGKGMKAADYLEEIKDEYYEYHGWDKSTSLQKRGRLKELGISDVVEVLEKEGGLA